MLFPILYGRGVGTCLGRLTSVYNVGGALAARITERAFTAFTLTGNISVRDITGVLNRAGIRVAHRCTHMLSHAIVHRVSRVGVSFRFSVWYGREELKVGANERRL